jgi:hypothetical protein
VEVYVGMDVHRKRSQVAVLDARGTQLLNRNLPNDPAELVTVLGGLAPGTPVAFEAAYGWGWLVDLLDDLGLEPHLVHPTRCKAIASAKLKNDKVDARTLAHLLRTDLLPEAWIAPQPVRDQRALLRHRVALVQLATAAATASTLCSPTAGCASSSACGQPAAGPGWRPWTCRLSSGPWSTTGWRSSTPSTRSWPAWSATCASALSPIPASLR